VIITNLISVICYSCRGNGYDGLDKECEECQGIGKVIEWRDK